MENIKRSSYLVCLAIFITTTSAFSAEKYAKRVVAIFSHGIADNKNQVNKRIRSFKKDGMIHYNENYVINTSYVSFNYPDATYNNTKISLSSFRNLPFMKIPSYLKDNFCLKLGNFTLKWFRVNYNETSLGGENEIARFYKAYQKTVSKDYSELKDESEDIESILFGVSRGGSNALILAGSYPVDDAKALVAESAFYKMEDVIENAMIKNNLGRLPLSYGQKITESIFKKYKRNGNSPEKCIKNISHKLPILLICSEEDDLVPSSSTMNIYKALVESGHPHTYIFTAKQGKHAFILQGPDGEKYQQVINAFYKKYNLPYIPSDAEKGESLLALCQPKI